MCWKFLEVIEVSDFIPSIDNLCESECHRLTKSIYKYSSIAKFLPKKFHLAITDMVAVALLSFHGPKEL
jgi:hypothetical protein